MPRDALIQIRQGTAANWASVNPILAAGEPGFETDTGKHKIGDGATAWSALPYFINEDALRDTYVALGPAPSGDATGATDTAAIQAVIDALPTAGGVLTPFGGGEIALQKGVYYIGGAGLSDNGRPIVLRGAGSATQLVAAAGFTGVVLTLATNYSSVSRLLINGNNVATGVQITGTRNRVDHLQIDQCSDGLNIHAPTSTANAFISDTQISSCVNGVNLVAGDDNQFTNVTVNSCSSRGYSISCANNIFTGCHVWGNATGVWVRGAHNRFVGCYVETNTSYGYDCFGVTGFQIDGGSVWKNGSSGVKWDSMTRAKIVGATIYDNTGAGLIVSSSAQSDLAVIGCHFYDDQAGKTQTYGAQFGTGPTNIVLVGNIAKDADHVTAGFSLGGATGVYAVKNIGLVTLGSARKVSGSAAIAPSATAATYGAAVTISPSAGSAGLFPVRMSLQGAGTFGSETLTVRVTATYSDGTTGNITKTFTSTSFTEFSTSDFYSLMKDGVAITQVAMDAQSTISSSAARASYFHVFEQV